LAFTGGVRFPTGEVDDPDNLVDTKFGDGAYALLFQLQNDFTGIKNLLLNATFRYDLVLLHKERLRVPDSVHQPLTTNEENVERNIGDRIELEISGMYDFFDGFSFSLLYKYGYKFKDHVSGNGGFNYKSLEDETDVQEHVGIASLCYSTIPLYQAKKFPIPITASVSYRDRFAGTNLLKTEYISLTLAIYF
jgi:lipopolysaccharide assembly outer membrane protein LptD (OstA)